MIDVNICVIKLLLIGGFFKVGNSMFIVGIEDDWVEEVLEIIKKICELRK